MAMGLEKAMMDGFRSSLRGEVLAPGECGYEEARQLYNAAFDKHPALIARCAAVEDVVAAVRLGRGRRLDIAIRGGGHNGGGLASVEGGLVIDLRGMNAIRVDPGARPVTAQGGALLRDLDQATHAFGLATPAGIISTTGVGGLTLGGGVGHLTRKCGLTIDNILEADLVLADGSFVTVNSKQNPDLYWAIRGGG